MSIKTVTESQSKNECVNKLIIVELGALTQLLSNCIASTELDSVCMFQGNITTLKISHITTPVISSWCISTINSPEKDDLESLFEEYAVSISTARLIQLHALLKDLNAPHQNVTLKLFDEVLEVGLTQGQFLHLKLEA